MPPTASNNELLNTVHDLQTRFTRIEADVSRLQQIVDGQGEDIKEGAKSTEVNLRLENLRLVTDGLKSNVADLTVRLGGLETNIVKKVEDISKQQHDDSIASMRRIIVVQSGVLMAILAAVIGGLWQILIHH